MIILSIIGAVFIFGFIGFSIEWSDMEMVNLMALGPGDIDINPFK